MTYHHFLLYFSTYFSLGIDVVISFHMKRENLHELFLRQDISGCKKIEIIYVKHNSHIYILQKEKQLYWKHTICFQLLWDFS